MIYREAYDINNLLGDLGGVVRVLLSMFGVLIYPLNHYLFVINSARKLYLARTREQNIFEDPSKSRCNTKIEQKMLNFTDPKNIPCSYGKSLKLEVLKHRYIYLTFKDTVLLFLNNVFNYFICKRICKWSKRDKLQKLYRKSHLKI